MTANPFDESIIALDHAHQIGRDFVAALPRVSGWNQHRRGRTAGGTRHSPA